MGALPAVSFDQWSRLKWLIEAWFSSPSWVLLSAIGLLIGCWRVCQLSWSRQLSRGVVAIVLLYLTTFSPLGAFLTVQGLMRPLPSDSGAEADAIVILGRGVGWVEAQSDAAAQLWHTERSPFVFVSGTPTETSRLISELRARHLPLDRIMGERCSHSTEENAQFTAAALASQQIEHLILVTDQPHMLRSMLTFRSLGFDVTPHPVALPNRLSNFQISKIALREYLALVNYFLLSRFEARSPDRLLVPPTSESLEAFKPSEAIAHCNVAYTRENPS